MKQAGKNRIINRLTIILGFLTAKPTAIGAGGLAQSRQEVYFPWQLVTWTPEKIDPV